MTGNKPTLELETYYIVIMILTLFRRVDLRNLNMSGINLVSSSQAHSTTPNSGDMTDSITL